MPKGKSKKKKQELTLEQQLKRSPTHAPTAGKVLKKKKQQKEKMLEDIFK